MFSQRIGELKLYGKKNVRERGKRKTKEPEDSPPILVFFLVRHLLRPTSCLHNPFDLSIEQLEFELGVSVSDRLGWLVD